MLAYYLADINIEMFKKTCQSGSICTCTGKRKKCPLSIVHVIMCVCLDTFLPQSPEPADFLKTALLYFFDYSIIVLLGDVSVILLTTRLTFTPEGGILAKWAIHKVQRANLLLHCLL